MLLRLAYILTALTALLVFGGVAGIVFDIAPHDLVALVILGAIAFGTLAMIPISIGLLVTTPAER
jgi:hypothetical protein